MPKIPNMPPTQNVPKLKDYLPYMTKQGGTVSVTPGIFNSYPAQLPMSVVPEPIRQATLGGSSADSFDRKLKPVLKENIRPDENLDLPSMGIRPTPVGSEQTSVPAMCTTSVSNIQIGHPPFSSTQQWPQNPPTSTIISNNYSTPYTPYQFPASMINNSVTSPSGIPASNATFSQTQVPNSLPSQPYNPAVLNQNITPAHQYNAKINFQPPVNPIPSPQTSVGVPRFGMVTQNGPASVSQPQMNPSVKSQPQTDCSIPNVSHLAGTSIGAYQYPKDSTTTSFTNRSVPPNPGYISTPQQTGTIPINNVTSPPMTQAPTYPSSQGTLQMNPYATGYAVPSSAYNQRPVSNIMNYQPSPPPQNYPANTQLGLASVTASMDTRTNTFNSSQPYSSSNNFVPSSIPNSTSSQGSPNCSNFRI
ncbi:tyrosine-protein phosphatase non-receptor type 23 [Caerostris extrusa]|uniref:Tyrosine-protein phosphatase non-receptor type 23 n=1 Tax=Caerostris extrusa TaxID=172846 RepID=A0AAV4XDY0_CAEEX|nr:tyrosine-protein phosphatase non-receptor type 23 [Caerostris extrusa]